MTDYQKYINALRKCAKEHENDRTFTGNIIVSDLCRDTANLLETIEQEPCENCVSRDTIRLKIAEISKYTDSKKLTSIRQLKGFLEKELEEPIEVTPDMCIGFTMALEYIGKFIKSLPSVTPRPKMGHWIPRNSFLLQYKCSECGWKSEKYHYCSNCGAKMQTESVDAVEYAKTTSGASRMNKVKIFDMDSPYCNQTCGTNKDRCRLFDTCKYNTQIKETYSGDRE